jgi:hypothetical protein
VARKKTSPDVSAIAARILATDNMLEAHKGAIAIAIQECGLPLSDKAVTIFVERIESALQPMIGDMRSLAASALGQDEEPAKVNPFTDGRSEMETKLNSLIDGLAARCTCGESKGACPVHEAGGIFKDG